MTTHKHWDHSGHNWRFAEAYPGIRIISGTNEPVHSSNENLDDGSSVVLLQGSEGSVSVEAFETPCHTTAHNIFIVTLDDGDDVKTRLMFTGDCLFEGGVGQFFEGDAAQMYNIFENLFTRRISTSTDQENTFMFFGHDYGWKNYMWASNYVFGER